MSLFVEDGACTLYKHVNKQKPIKWETYLEDCSSISFVFFSWHIKIQIQITWVERPTKLSVDK